MTQIKTIEIVGIQDGPHLLISAGVHGDEYEPMEVCRELAIYLKDRKEVLRGRVTLVPVVNEPAFRLASRKGPDGKDLARICPGNRDGSISEVIAAEFSDLIRTADYFIDMHNGGHTYGIMPFSGYVLHEDLSVRELQKAMAFACNLPVVWATDATLEGRSLSIARDANVPAIYTETGGSSVYDPQITKLLLNSCLNVLHLLKMLEIEVAEAEIRHFLEDFRKHSGHLQRLLPSPATGFFVAGLCTCRLYHKRRSGGTCERSERGACGPGGGWRDGDLDRLAKHSLRRRGRIPGCHFTGDKG